MSWMASEEISMRIRGSEETEAFFVGFDPELRKTHAIYQRMLVEFICLGVERGSRRVNMGRTALRLSPQWGRFRGA